MSHVTCQNVHIKGKNEAVLPDWLFITKYKKRKLKSTWHGEWPFECVLQTANAIVLLLYIRTVPLLF